ncbi:MAG TPA: hypothetical protein VJ725_00965 [Thermoanaerobaculia bacterium]|nr:hypothetical protein [Thermoanaerobaculia bacterium]
MAIPNDMNFEGGKRLPSAGEDESLARFAVFTLLSMLALLVVLRIPGQGGPALQSSTLTPDSKVSIRGIGPVRVGMSLEEATNAMGSRLVRSDGQNGSEDCYYVEPEGGPPGLSFMIVSGQIARVDIQNPAFESRSGARVGLTEEKVLSMFGSKIRVEGHQYDENGHYLIFEPADPQDKNYSMIFETDGKVVTTFRAGRLPEVAYVEHCL